MTGWAGKLLGEPLWVGAILMRWDLSNSLPCSITCQWHGVIPILEPPPCPSQRAVAVQRQLSCYHGLLHLHSDDVLVDVVALILAGHAVVDVLPQVVLAATRGTRAQGMLSAVKIHMLSVFPRSVPAARFFWLAGGWGW